MAVKLRPAAKLEPVEWPTGEEVAVVRPNVYAAAFWDNEVATIDVANKPAEFREGLVKFVAMVCPSKPEQEIREQCDDDFLWLVANYSRDRLVAAQEFLATLMGKSPAGTDPASSPLTDTGTSPAGSLERTASA